MNNNLLKKSDFSIQQQVMNSFLKPEVSSVNEEGFQVDKKQGNLSEEASPKELLKKNQKLESLLNLYSDLYKQTAGAAKIDEYTGISTDVFFNNYYFLNKPVIIKSLMADWPALAKWTPDYFSQKYGDVPVEITKGREKDNAYEKNFHTTVSTICFREFVEQIKKRPFSNDMYLVARNYFFSNPQFNTLHNDIIPPCQIIDTNYSGAGNMKLWFGPGGTITPLHHDKHSILFCQVYGRKHFKMIPSFELPKIYNKDRYYSEVDPEQVNFKKYPLFKKAITLDTIVNPGDILFIPVGWWHWVESLEVSISVTFSNFKVPGYNNSWNCE
jgi:hypothetical protein